MPHAFIKPGTTVGLLRVIKQEGHTPIGERLYRCICACGKKRHLRTSILREGRYYSCGCYRRKHPALKRNNAKKEKVERNRMMLFMKRMGRSYTVIAEKYGISPSSVKSVLRRMTHTEGV